MKPIKKVMLCPACGGCPEIAVYDNEVCIGKRAISSGSRKTNGMSWSRKFKAVN